MNPATSEVARAIAASVLAVGIDSFRHDSRLISRLAEYVGLEDRFVLPFGAESDALEYVCRAYLNSGNETLIAGPVDTLFHSCEKRCGALIRLSLAGSPFAPDILSLIQCITPKTRLVYLMNPNYPSGTIWTNGDIERVLDSAPDALVVVDETYFEFFGQTCSQLVRRHDNLIVVRRLGEELGMSAFPCSYVLASPDILACLNAVRGRSSIAAPVQAGAIAALDHRRLSAEYIRQVRENRTYIALRLKQFGITTRTTHTDGVLLEVSCPAKVLSFLSERNISADDCSRLPQMDNYVFISVGDNEYCANVIQCFVEMPERYYLFASIDTGSSDCDINESHSSMARRNIVDSTHNIARKLVLNRSVGTISATALPDVAGRLSRSGAALTKRDS